MRTVWENSPATILSKRASAARVSSSVKGLWMLTVPTRPSPSRTGTQIKLVTSVSAVEVGAADDALPDSPPGAEPIRFRKSGCWVTSGMTAASPDAWTAPVTPSPTA